MMVRDSHHIPPLAPSFHIPALITNESISVDIASIQVPPPDLRGYCRLGASIACARAAFEHAQEVMGVVPRRMEYSAVHLSQYLGITQTDRPLAVRLPPLAKPVARLGCQRDDRSFQSGGGISNL